ncbi:hypothetical protein P280DRAFT_472218 [Massarina eburnea CBS 473.64]|uniref:Uncharacterized protein n=1 Tax=Massarina eburnea CBS 473.64 TaxID=1395130 RepID=A0A6A6RQX4_9PLEO|nr:hypothetical protein P280DRAFT_472218 [Massarina eburnea CBS 473.64]
MDMVTRGMVADVSAQRAVSRRSTGTVSGGLTVGLGGCSGAPWGSLRGMQVTVKAEWRVWYVVVARGDCGGVEGWRARLGARSRMVYGGRLWLPGAVTAPTCACFVPACACGPVPPSACCTCRGWKPVEGVTKLALEGRGRGACGPRGSLVRGAAANS